MLAMAFCLGLCATVFAYDTADSYTITIENTTANESYSAYKIFDAKYDSKTGAVTYTIDSSANANWYNYILVYGSDIFKMTQVGDTDTYRISLADGVSDEDIVAFFEGIEIPGDVNAAAAATGLGTGGALSLDVTSSGAGYYFVTSTLGAVVTLTSATPDATVIDKNNGPSVEKKIKNSDGDLVDWDTEAMGDEVEFVVDADVPLYDGDKLVTEYIFTDEMEDGLEIELDDSNITYNIINGKYYLADTTINKWITLVNSDGSYWAASEDDSREGIYMGTFTMAAYNITVELTGVQTITRESDGENILVATGFVLTYYTYDVDSYVEGDPDTIDTSNYPTTATIYIDYTAHVEEDAEFEEENTIALAWLVTPYDNPAPEDSTPGGNEEDKVEVYETELKLIKIDGETGDRLGGATFTLSGENLDEVKLSTDYTYTPVTVENPAGVDDDIYYKLTTGEYTTTAPTDETMDAYEDDTQYTLEITYEYQRVSEDGTVVIGTTSGDGLLTFLGLNEGTYTLTETGVPDSYNGLDGSIEITISYNEETGEFTAVMTGADGNTITDTLGNTVTLTQDEDGAIVVTVENNAGIVLPGTGGIGTTIFYIIGGILVVVAVVVLVTRRRMRKSA
ncbi:MAG: LPXTG cell wall anchor domain-containing protein [Clostridia bacterium]|nr:LPXTG cell wall anchor domain-containing protein [Clostridia bacterium]